MEKKLDLYLYYDGTDKYKTENARFWGNYERAFEKSYKGKPENKEKSLNSYMADLITEKARDSFAGQYTPTQLAREIDKIIEDYFNVEENNKK